MGIIDRHKLNSILWMKMKRIKGGFSIPLLDEIGGGKDGARKSLEGFQVEEGA